MATGIVKRHSAGCPAKEGRRCTCKAGYEAWVSVRHNGRRRKIRKTFKREAEARSWRTDALGEAKKNALRPVRHDTRTLIEALERWLDDVDADRVWPKKGRAYKPNTKRSYRGHVEKHVRPSGLAYLRVTEVRREDVQRFVESLLGEGLEPSTIANVLCPLAAFYGRLEERGQIASDPTAKIDLPRPGKSRPKRIATPEEAAALLAALPVGDRPLWATGFYAGLRRGELQALRSCDVDLGASLIRVERGWDHVEGAIDPKSEASRRTVPLLAVLRDYLDERKLATGRDGEDLVFGRTARTPFAPQTIGKRARKAWEGEALRPITLHECRHTFASLLIDSGANPKAIQAFMGHSKIQTTFDTYGHLFPGSDDEVRERMDAYLGARGSSSVRHSCATEAPSEAVLSGPER